MELIIGGAYNSKLNFALKYYNLKQEDFQNGAECNLNDAFNKKFVIEEILNENKEPINEVKRIKEHVYIKCPYKLNKYDILRKKEK